MILTGENNEILRKKSEKVSFEKAQEIVKKLFQEVETKEAAGIAAPQIGENYRVLLAQVDDKMIAFINPEIISFSLEKELGEEGCLSLPDIWGYVPRAKEILLSFTDIKGKQQEKRFSDWNARVIQHEIDHLEGVLFIDRVVEAPVKKDKEKDKTI